MTLRYPISRVFLFIYFFSNYAYAQTSGLGSWNIVNIKYPLTNGWSLFGETQLRSLEFYNQFHFYEYKGGVSFAPRKDVSFALGAGSYQTYREGGNFVKPKNNNEFRIWPQLVFTQSIGILRIEQRYRSELRFTSNGYRNRFRYRIGLSYPLPLGNPNHLPWTILASNEIFFTNREPYFERNRAILAVQYRINNYTSFQLGYLQQFDYKINDETGSDFLQVGCFFELDGNRIKENPLHLDHQEN